MSAKLTAILDARSFEMGASKIGASIDKIVSRSNKLKSKGDKSFRNFGSSFRRMVDQVTDLASDMAFQLAAAFSFSEIVDATVKIQRFEAVMASFTGSLPSAVKELGSVFDLANKLGVSFEGMALPFAKFAAAASDFSKDEVHQVFEAFATAASGLQMNMNDVNGTFLALQQIVSKGALSMEELRLQLAERIPGAMGKAAEAAKMNMEDFEEAVRTKTIDTRVWLVEFARIVEEDFALASEIARKSLNASMQRFSNNLLIFKSGLGTASNAAETFAGVLNYISENLFQNETAFQSISILLGTFANIAMDTVQGFTEAITDNVDTVKTWSKWISGAYSTLKNFFELMVLAGTVIGTVFGGLGLIIATHVEAAADTFVNLYDAVAVVYQRVVDKTVNTVELIGSSFSALNDILPAIWDLIKGSFNSLIDSMKGTLANMFGKLSEVLPDISVFDEFKRSLNQSADSLRDTMTDVVPMSVAERLDEFKGRVKSTYGKLASARKTYLDEDKEATKNLVDNISTVFMSQTEVIKNAAMEDVDTVLTAIALIKEAMDKLNLEDPLAGVHVGTQGVREETKPPPVPDDDDTYEKVTDMADKYREIAQLFGDIGTSMGDAFGDVGVAIDGLTGSLDKMIKKERDIVKALDKFKEDNAEDINAIAAAEARAIDASTKARVSSYGDMAVAAQGFFEEGTSGYEAMGDVAKVFHAIEMAMAIESMLVQLGVLQTLGMAKAINAVVGQGTGDPYTAFARMAAMAAVVGALGFAVGGVSSPGDSTARRQEEAGTGTVLGDSSVKSESIANAIKSLEDIAEIELRYTSEMLAALKKIETGISGLVIAISRQLGFDGAGFAGVPTGFDSSGAGSIWIDFQTSGVSTLNDKVITPILAGFGGTLGELADGFGTKMEEFFSSAFGTRTKISDFGLVADAQRLSDILDSGLDISGYIDVLEEKKAGWVTYSESLSRDFVDLDRGIAELFTDIIGGMVDGMRSAGSALGISVEDFNARLEGVMINFGNISTEDLVAEELETQLAAIFSSMSDTLAEDLFPEMVQFQQLGEGMAETVIRVASGFEQASNILDSFGIDMINLFETIEVKVPNFLGGGTRSVQVANIDESGDAAVELVKESLIEFHGATSSVSEIIRNLSGDVNDLAIVYTALAGVMDLLSAAGAKFTDVSLEMIQGAGGLDALTNGLEAYFTGFFSSQEQLTVKTAELEDEFYRLGFVHMPQTREEFRALIDTIKTSNGAYDETLGGLMALVGGFEEFLELTSQVADETDNLSRAQQDLLDAEIDRLERVASATKGIDLTVRQHGMSGFEVSLDNIDTKFNALADTLKDLGVDVSSTNFAAAKSIEIERARDAEISRLVTERTKAADDFFGLEKKRISEETKAKEKMYGAMVSSAKDSIKDVENILSMLSSARSRMSLDSLDAKSVSHFEAKASLDAALKTARSGDISAVKDLQKPLDTLVNADTGLFESFVDYQRDYWQTYLKIEELEGLTSDQISIEEKTLKVLENQLDAVATSEIRQLEAMDLQRETMIEQIEATTAIEVAIQTLPDAIATAMVASTTDVSNVDVIIPLDASAVEALRPLTSSETQGTISVAGISELRAEISQLRQEQAASQFAIARNTGISGGMLKKWDGDGMPAERV